MQRALFILAFTFLINNIIAQIEPSADFTLTPGGGCTPLTVQFTDESEAGSYPIVEYTWVIDGREIKEKNPIYTFTKPGDYDILLQIEDEEGIVDKAYKTNAIKVSAKPNPGFMVNKTLLCKTPAILNITNTSSSNSGSDLSGFLWDFGDGTTSTAENPNHTYTDYGRYTISLVVTDELGCKDTIIKSNHVEVYELKAEIGYPDTVCVNEAFILTNESVGDDVRFWDAGGQSYTNDESINLAYSISGTKRDTLTVWGQASNGYCGPNMYIAEYFVERPSAFFDMDTFWACSYPIEIGYTDRSNFNTTAWQWSFGDGSSSTLQNPVHTYTSPPASHEDFYMVKLKITTSNGCIDSSTRFFEDRHPQVNPISTKGHGCIPLYDTIIDFTQPIEGIDQRSWTIFDLQNNNIVFTETTGADDNQIEFRFDTYGTYEVQLAIHDTICGWDTGNTNVLPGDTIKAGFCFPDTACAVEDILFLDKSEDIADTSRPDEWIWDFGDGFMLFTQNPVYSYYKDMPTLIPITTMPGSPGYKKAPSYPDSLPGYMDITLIAGHHHCYDTIKDSIYISGPIANIEQVTFDCNDPLVYHFENLLIEADSYNLSFDDGKDTTITFSSIKNTEDTIMHNYSPGIYNNVQLTAYNSITGCQHQADYSKYDTSLSFLQTIEFCVSDIVLSDFTTDKDNYCWDSTISINAGSTQNSVKYLWAIENQATGEQVIPANPSDIYDTATDPFTEYKISKRGVYTISLNSEACNLCHDIKTKTVRLYKPYVNFEVDDRRGCSPAYTATFDTIHKQVVPDTHYVKWKWDFGNDTIKNRNQGSPVSVEYKGIRSYFTPNLEVTDLFGCKNDTSLNNYILITIPDIGFSSAKDEVCKNEVLPFSNATTTLGSTLSYKWKFGDGDTSDQMNPSHAYKSDGTYSVELVAYDTIGCSDSLEKNNLIAVHSIPIAAFDTSRAEHTCYPAYVNLHDASIDKGYNIEYWYWQFFDNNGQLYKDDTVYRTSYSPDFEFPSKYDVQLTIATDKGCVDDTLVEDIIIIGGPYAEFHHETPIYTPVDKVCRKDTVKFVIDSMNNGITQLIWHLNVDKPTGKDIGNSLDTINDMGLANTSYTYNSDGKKFIYLEMVGEGEDCIRYTPAPYRIRNADDSLFVIPISAEFTRGDTACGINANVQFRMSDSISNPDYWYWNFGDGSPLDSFNMNPTHVYTDTGSYIAMLYVEGGFYGCVDTVKQNINVYPLPKVSLYPHDTLICDYDSVELNTFFNKNYEYTWHPTLNISNPKLNNPLAYPDQPTTYYVTVSDKNSRCKEYDTAFIDVQNHPDIYFYYVRDLFDTIMTDNEIFVPLGDTIMPFAGSSQPGVKFQWDNLDTTAQYITPLQSMEFNLIATDSITCYKIPGTLHLEVSEGTVDVPTAFTPNNDGINDVIKIGGWGIGKVVKFQVYNRWGQLLFETHDMNQGWDGTYKGKKQNVDTYVYVVKIETLRGDIVRKTGTFTLVR